MKINELLEANIKIHSLLEVRSAYNGKVLCRNFDRKKHIEIGERELVSLWASTKKQGDDPGGWIYPVLCCYNEHGMESSRCSYCQVYARGEGLATMKTESYLCEGYQRKYEAKEALKDGNTTD